MILAFSTRKVLYRSCCGQEDGESRRHVGVLLLPMDQQFRRLVTGKSALDSEKNHGMIMLIIDFTPNWVGDQTRLVIFGMFTSGTRLLTHSHVSSL